MVFFIHAENADKIKFISIVNSTIHGMKDGPQTVYYLSIDLAFPYS